LGLTGEPEGVDGSRVEEMVLAGQIEEVARHCESDVLNTYRAWFVYELFRGSITANEFDWSVQSDGAGLIHGCGLLCTADYCASDCGVLGGGMRTVLDVVGGGDKTF
jgi:hypothetical protein